jgi:hypothetical protein
MLSYVWRFLFTEDDHEDEGAPAAEAQGGSDAETDGSSEDDEGAESGDEDVCRGLTNGDTEDDDAESGEEDEPQEDDPESDEEDSDGDEEDEQDSDSEPDEEPPQVPEADDATEYRCILSSGDLAVMRDFVDTIRAECIRRQISIGASHRAVLLSRCARDGIPCECPEPTGELAEPDSGKPQGDSGKPPCPPEEPQGDSGKPQGDSDEDVASALFDGPARTGTLGRLSTENKQS